MTDQTSETPVQDAFEEWFCGGGKLERSPGGYSLMSAQSAWVAWQAGAEWSAKKEREACAIVGGRTAELCKNFPDGQRVADAIRARGEKQ